MTALILFQSPERRNLLFQNFAPIETLLSALESLLIENNAVNILDVLIEDKDFSENTKRVFFEYVVICICNFREH